ncbi:beta-galactosidase trimerization domain-containing protein [Phycisphaerales bacterium AB-hyl4]|uniref:beta-galactosidase n=1 Tax=Natronomicrosphaera hydrolytica TaxID=3242702 RepID=A0ABV4U5L9_9BACT
MDESAAAVFTSESAPSRGGTYLDVTLSNAVTYYTLQYHIVRDPDNPDQADPNAWRHAPRAQGYLPLGITQPSAENWFRHGFIRWTFGDYNIQEVVPEFRVIREGGDDAAVEFVWDTPVARAVARFVLAKDSDMLMMFGHYELKQEIDGPVRMLLNAYPVTFSAPHQREATTATGTRSEGTHRLDLQKERWVLLEDTFPGRSGAGPAGLLLGSHEGFDSATVRSIGGYNQSVDLRLNQDKRQFAVAFHESPDLPEIDETRLYFRRHGNAMASALARYDFGQVDEEPVTLPIDERRVAQLRDVRGDLLNREYERWEAADPDPQFPWASKLPNGPISIGLLTPRYTAYDTMQLGARLDVDVQNIYFDTPSALADTSWWLYHPTLDTLGTPVAEREAMRVATNPDHDLFLVAGLDGSAVPERVREAILKQVYSGKTLLITGQRSRWDRMAAWPDEMTETRDDSILASVLDVMPWSDIPGLRRQDPDADGDEPFRAYRYGQGQVIVFQPGLGARQSALVPQSINETGLDVTMDRVLALHGVVMSAAAGREWIHHVRFASHDARIAAGQALDLSLDVDSKLNEHDELSARVRVQDEFGTTYKLEHRSIDLDQARVRVPALPASQMAYFVDIALEDAEGRSLGYASTALRVEGDTKLGSLSFAPKDERFDGAVPLVDLPGEGVLQVEYKFDPGQESPADRMVWTVGDVFGRLVTQKEQKNPGEEGVVELTLSRPITVPHHLKVTAYRGDTPLYTHQQAFTRPVPYPYDEFSAVIWGAAPESYPSLRHAAQKANELGIEGMLLPHMRAPTGRVTGDTPARLFAQVAETGMRTVPYITRIAGEGTDDHKRKPSLYDAQWISEHERAVDHVSRMAAPYQPAAYTLGDENYILRSVPSEVADDPETMDAFRDWLEERYETIDALNEAWDREYRRFDDIGSPVWLEEAAGEPGRAVAWFDHKVFMDHAFAHRHEAFADIVRKRDPNARVGFDGFMRYHWMAGYDFDRLTRNLDLNQVYSHRPPQGEIVSSLSGENAFTGEWQNHLAGMEEGFAAIPWHNLFKGHNSVWWWTMWGNNTSPFYPDLTLAPHGETFTASLAQIRQGLGRLLVQAERDHSKIAILYNPIDIFASKLAESVAPGSIFAGDKAWVRNHEGVIRLLDDLGYSYRHVAASRLIEQPDTLNQYEVLFLPLATCLSDELAEHVREFVQLGGTVIADGRTGIMREDGGLRDARPLNDLFGIDAVAGLEALSAGSSERQVVVRGQSIMLDAIEPSLKVADAKPLLTADDTPMVLRRQHERGQAVMLNFSFKQVRELRLRHEADPLLALFGSLLRESNVRPHARLVANGGAARNTKMSLFRNGASRYLGIEQDIFRDAFMGTIPDEEATVRLDEPTYVYDMRTGELVDDEPTDTWRITLKRGYPHLFALLPYRIVSLDVEGPASVEAGQSARLTINVGVSEGTGDRHVVHVQAIPPNSDEPYRMYSHNVDCDADGVGESTIPFAVNDPAGTWIIIVRDAATGKTTTRELELVSGG